MTPEDTTPAVQPAGATEKRGTLSQHRSVGGHELMSRAIEPCGVDYRAVDLLMRACGRPLGHGGHHFVHALPLEPVPDGLAPAPSPVLDRSALPEPTAQTAMVVLSAEDWQLLGRVLAVSEEARERDIENARDDRAEYEEWAEEAWDRADAAIADAAARGEL